MASTPNLEGKTYGQYLGNDADINQRPMISFRYEMLIELVTQSWGTGFVGTKGSTMSLLGERRTVHWRKGIAVEVK